MNKRFFLTSLAAGAGAMLTQGCVHQEVRRFLDTPATPTAGGPFPFTAEDIQAANDARALMRSPVFGASAGPSNADLTRAYDSFVSTLAPFKASGAIPLASATPVALATGDLMKLLDDASRAAAKQPVSRTAARQAQSLVFGTVITVPPRSKVEFTQKGYCLDSQLPAPGKDEKFVLRNINKLVPAELMPLYSGLTDLSKRDRRVQRAMQYLVWALREAGTKGKHANAISKAHLDMMGQAYPAGDLLFMQYHQQQMAKNSNPLGELAKALTTVKSGGKTYDIGDLVDLFAGNDPQKAQTMADQTMDDVLNRPIPGEIPNDNSDYSMLSPGVAAHAVGKAQLTPTITIANTTDQPYQFDTRDYFAETQRQAQRVALGAPEQVRADTLAGAPEMEQFEKDLRRHLRDMALENLHRIVQDKLLNTMKSKFAGAALNATPVLGNLLQLSNLLTGKDWQTGEPLGCVAQALAAIGTVPGAGTFMQLAGGNKTGLINNLAQSSYTRQFLSGVERTAMARNISVWLSNDTARAAYGYTLPPGQLSNQISNALTGGCQRTWS